VLLLDQPFCDDLAGRHLGRHGPMDSPQKEQCKRTVYTVLRTGPGVQRPRSPYDQSEGCSVALGVLSQSKRADRATALVTLSPSQRADRARYEVPLS